MVTDDELAELMKQVAADVFPAASVLVNQAEQQGRRLRRRRRAWIAGGNAIAVLGIAALAATVVQQPSGPRPSADRGFAGTQSSPSTAAPGKSAAAGHTTTPATQYDRHRASKPMTPHQMVAVLRSLLPAGSVLTDVRSNIGPGSLEVNYNDGKGLADIMVDITPFTKVESAQQMNQPGSSSSDVLALSCPHPLWTDEGLRPLGALPISCAVRTLPGGGLERDAVMYADGYGFYGYNIYDQRPDHVEVSIQVGNGYFDPYLPRTTRATPPGSMKLWEQVVESPLWRA